MPVGSGEVAQNGMGFPRNKDEVAVEAVDGLGMGGGVDVVSGELAAVGEGWLLVVG